MRRPSICASLGALLALALTVAPGAPADPVARESASPPSISCLNKSGTKYLRKSAPSTCAHFGPGGSFAGGVFLTNLKWRGFGGESATATGIECGFHLPCENIPVQVTIYRIRSGCGSRAYTRLRSTSSLGTTTVKLRRCAGPA